MFAVDVVRCATVPDAGDEEVIRRGTSHFVYSAAELATCDVDLSARSINVRARASAEDDYVAHFLLDVVLPRMAGLRGRCLHAAAVEVDGRAFALIGASGAGKSTLAARLAIQGATLLGDDCACVEDGVIRPTYRPSRLWPDSAALLGLDPASADATGKVAVREEHGVSRRATPVPLREVLVVDARQRAVGVSEALQLLLAQTFLSVVPEPENALDDAVDFLRCYGPRRTIQRNATLADFRRLSSNADDRP